MRQYLLIIFLLSILGLQAQQTPNGSFETWYVSYNPYLWGTWASAIQNYNATSALSLTKLAAQDTTIGIPTNGKSALRISVDTVTLPFQGQITLAGFACVGASAYIPPPTGNGLRFGYYTYRQRPDSLFFDYNYQVPAGHTDSAFVSIILSRYDTFTYTRDTMLDATFYLPSSGGQWVRSAAFSLRSLYHTAPGILSDTLQLLFYPSHKTNPMRGTLLWIDTVRFDASVNIATSLSELENRIGISAYPDPASDHVMIGVTEGDVGSQIYFFDAEGREVYSARVSDLMHKVDTHDWPAGNYLIAILGRDRLTRASSHICIHHQ